MEVPQGSTVGAVARTVLSHLGQVLCKQDSPVTSHSSAGIQTVPIPLCCDRFGESCCLGTAESLKQPLCVNMLMYFDRG